MRISVKHKIKTHLAACTLAGMAFSGSALGAIVYSGPVNIPIPDDIDGVYFNVVTGVTGSATGWDINPYSAIAGNFNLWGATTQTWFNTAGTITNASGYVLPLGTTIPNTVASFFRPGGGTNIGPVVNLNSSDNYFGIYFLNESTSANNVGWVQIQFGATAGTRAIVAYAYENTGATIAAGDTGAPAPEAAFGFDVSSLNFGNVTIGTASAPQSVTLTNFGNGLGTVSGLDTGDAAYSITGGSCGAPPFDLDPDDSCTIAITFSPSVAGPVEGALTIDNGGIAVVGGGVLGFPQSVELNGIGVQGGPGPGGGDQPVVANVPANSPWALAALLGLFGLVAGAMLRRR